MNAGKILGVHNYFFLDQQDDGYTLDIHKVYRGIWNIPLIKETLAEHLNEEKYNFVFVLLPHKNTHGHHKAATVLTLEAVNNMESTKRPIVLGVDTPKDTPEQFSELPEFPLTKAKENKPLFSFNRLQPIGFQGKLNYKIIVNWAIAEHKSQGAFQSLMNKGDAESFYYFSLNDEKGIERTRALFDSLNNVNTEVDYEKYFLKNPGILQNK